MRFCIGSNQTQQPRFQTGKRGGYFQAPFSFRRPPLEVTSGRSLFEELICSPPSPFPLINLHHTLSLEIESPSHCLFRH